ncbi:peptidoglycan D,D-transpeptidase FtsI family protein [Demequina activiva]|uniref:Cell division protein FtsI n=1 Tax=Demequina activiva TaxID=1582364 RepID=A0A919Q445_9MICO|nr:penicillin-binding transpeptidase domain-containing protein [Demequina activiva]GIG54128.1 cell division protein FtsI [Demequina activiva]
MNEPARRLSVIVLVLFLALLGATSWIQVINAEDLNQDPRNVRTLYREFGNFRGPIVVDGQSVVYSTPVDDPYNYQRSYTDGELFASATGFYSIVYGRTGLEQTENQLLNGSDDSLFWTRLGNLFAGEQQQGASVETTLSGSLQRVAAEALGDRAGAVVALDPETGKVLAMVTSPTYDPALLAGHDTSVVNENYANLLADPAGPLINRAIAGDTYPPGSTFKLVVSAAALESGFTPDTELYAPQELELPGTTTTIGNYGGVACDPSDHMSLADALRVSCNTAFADLGMSLGWGVIERKAHDFGWDEPLDIPLPVTASRLPESPDAAQTAMSAIGQYDVRATPLQMAMVAAAIGNDGTLMRPYLVDAVRAPDLKVLSTTEPEVLRESMTRSDATDLREMMVDVVSNGTGAGARIGGVEVAGKTGTAETGRDTAPHTWFVSFAPADDPVVALAVIVEEGGDGDRGATGGTVAAPIAKAVMEEALRLDAEGDL